METCRKWLTLKCYRVYLADASILTYINYVCTGFKGYISGQKLRAFLTMFQFFSFRHPFGVRNTF